ncbi:AAA family ATPase [Salinithrix halophila]|uniref:AAA family ATPase n=1 Tax=Salinithrix halophila TaxID=1485204 RepID=A0ABV8JD77_9BACL
MKIDRVYFRGFGRWADREFLFQDGINLVEAPNEAGKSTLIQGITALLYGAKKEGVSRRQREDWYDDYQPWDRSEYGGEVDFTLDGREYRLIRSLRWDEDREQLVDKKTGRDLTEEFGMDRRKDRCFLEELTGLSSSLFTRVAHLSSRSFAGDHQVVERVRQIITQGEEKDLKPVLEQLEQEIQRIGKTTQSRGKPFGAAHSRARELEEEVEELRDVYQNLRGEQARLAHLKEERVRLDRDREDIRGQVAQIAKEVQQAERRETLREQEKNLRFRLSRWESVASKLRQLEGERREVLPPRLLSEEEADELRQLIHKHESPAARIGEIRERLESLEKETRELEEEKRPLLEIDEALLQRHLHRLDEASRLEEKLQPPDGKGTMDDRLKGIQLEKDYNQLVELQEREERCRRKRGDLEDAAGQLTRRLDLLDREKFLTQVVKSQIPPGKSSSKWLWMGGIGLLLSLFAFQNAPGIGVLLLLGSGVVLYRYNRLRIVDRQVKQNWEAQRQGLLRDREQARRERKEAEENGEPLDPERLRSRLSEEKNALKATYNELAVVMQEQEAILDRWHVPSAAELYRLVESQRQRIQEREANRKLDQQNRERLAEISRDVQAWATEAELKDRLGPYDAKGWHETLSAVADEARKAREVLQRLKLETTSLTRDRDRLQELLERTEKGMAKWTEELGTSDTQLWTDWILASDHVRRLDEQIRELSREKEEITRTMQTENWEQRLEETERELASLNVFPAEETSLEELKQRLKEQEHALEKMEAVCRQKEVEVLKLEERLSTQFDRLPSLADRETLLEEAADRLRELEKERTALETARDVLLEAAREVQEDIAPKLRPHASRWIQEVTSGRYEDLLIDPTDGLRMSVFVPETGERQPVERLSRGTVDQMYFAMRLALIRFFSENTTPLPLILDDSLVHFDGERLREALRILSRLSTEHQVILCTCQPREGDMLEKLGISFTRHML